jgi:hypothetical protein
VLVLSLAACHRGTHSQEAVRQGVIDHLAKNGFNMSNMDVKLDSADIKGNQADATVTIGVKGGNATQGMSRKYHLEQQGNQWVVTGSQDAGSPHGGSAMPGAENPHGAGAVPGAGPGGASPSPGGGGMPSPQDLPPSSKKK